MSHMRMVPGIFWGIVLIFMGLGIIIHILFNIDIPVFKILVALFFIYLGLKILTGDRGVFNFHHSKNDAVFTEGAFKETGEEDKEYNVIFGKGVYDLREIDLRRKMKVEINAVFGGAEVRLKKGTPYRIKLESVFGGSNLPDGNTTVLGTGRYQSSNYNPDLPHLFIKANVVFGGLQVDEY